MVIKGIYAFALILSFELILGGYCDNKLLQAVKIEPSKRDSIFCQIAKQSPDDDGVSKSPNVYRVAPDMSISSSATVSFSPSPSTEG